MDATTTPMAAPSTIEEQIEQAMRFMAAVFDLQDVIEIRVLPAGRSRWFTLADDKAAREAVRAAIKSNAAEHSPLNVYVGANPRGASGQRTKDSVKVSRALFADFDNNMTVEEALQRIRDAGLPEPSIVIVSGGGVHVYWLLAEQTTDMAAWTATMKGIIAAVGSDKSIHNPDRIMRLPGTRNVKPERPGRPMCHIVSMNGTRHSLTAFPSKARAKKPTAAKAPRDARLCDIGQRYLDTGHVDRPRHENLFTIACDMSARGWTHSEAHEAIMARVHLVEPAFTDEQLRDLPRQIHNAFKEPREAGFQSSQQLHGVDADDERQPKRRLVLVRASEIECTAINWLWPQRIVGDGLTIITGPVGISKSLISVDVSARVTTAGKWPDGTGHAPLGSVILFGAEDDAGKVVVPRLMAAGADLERVHVCQGTVSVDEDDEPAAVILERHIGELRAALDAVSDCRLIVFDPLPDYIAADENKSSEVRAALVPLAKLAQEKNVAVVAVLHQNKKNDLTTVQRIAGSGAFAQIARIVLSIGTHPEDADKPTGKRRVMLVSKNNYGERDVGQAYEIESRTNDQPGIVWHSGTVTMDADDIARRPTGGQEHESRRGEAVDALREMLAEGEKNAGAVIESLQDAGLGRRQIDHAAAALNVIKRKMRDGWYWRLPAREPGRKTSPQPEPAFAAWAGDERFNYA